MSCRDLILESSLMHLIKLHVNQSSGEYRGFLTKKLRLLDNVQTVIQIFKEQDRTMPINKIQCIVCSKQLPNVLVMAVHHQLWHPQKNISYQLQGDTLRVMRQFEDPRIKTQKSYEFVLLRSCAQRLQSFVRSLLTKSTIEPPKKQPRHYFSPHNIYEQLPISELNKLSFEDSIPKHSLTLNDAFYQNISIQQRRFYELWNAEVVRLQSKFTTSGDLSVGKQLLFLLRKFIEKPELRDLRTTFALHLNVLYCHAKINQDEFLEMIHHFDHVHRHK